MSLKLPLDPWFWCFHSFFYQIHVQELGDDEDNLLNPPLRFDVLDGMARRFNVTDLQPDTKYAVQVAALTRKGDGLRSKKVVVKTPGGNNNL